MLAITRAVSRRITECELTHVDRTRIDLEVARAQHAAYEAALEACGCRVHQLAEEPSLADSVFVEDTAIVLDEVAVLMRPGAASRRPEVASIAEALGPLRALRAIQAPGTIDGGDVLQLGRVVWVGLSSRTTTDGAAQLRVLLAPFGYDVRTTSVAGALHLKTAVTQVAADALMVNPTWIDPGVFGAFDRIEVDPAEPFAANAVWVNGRVLHSTQFPRTQARLRSRGIDLVGVEASELAKAEGGVTCCSLLVR